MGPSCRRSASRYDVCSWCCQVADVFIERVKAVPTGRLSRFVLQEIAREGWPGGRRTDMTLLAEAVLDWLVRDEDLRHEPDTNRDRDTFTIAGK